MKLSADFTLEEMLRSQTAVRHDIDMTPGGVELANMRKLATAVLQPIRDELGAAIHISSGFRPPALNTLIGGSETSDHVHGSAADIACHLEPLRFAELIETLIHRDRLPVKQLIHEFGAWCHVSTWPADQEDGAPEILTAYRLTGSARYIAGVRRVNPKTRSLV